MNYFRKSGDFIAEFADFRCSLMCPDMPQLPLSDGGYRRDRCYGGVAGFCKKKHPLCREGLRVLYGRWIRKGAESEVASII